MDGRSLCFGLPAAALLVIQIGLYIWMAPRGFDFTDEAYYFLNYLYWREIVGLVSLFGAYFEWPFRLLGQSVAAIRVFSLLALLGCAAFFMWEALRQFSRGGAASDHAEWPFVLTGSAASMFYFGYLSTTRAPSYNLLSLCSMMLATALLLRLLRSGMAGLAGRALAFCYGVVVGACILGKASSGLLLLAFHSLFFVLLNRNWSGRILAGLLIAALLGVCLNLAILQWTHPHWMTVLLEGVAIFNYSSENGLVEMANVLRWDIQRQAFLLPWAAGLLLAFGAVVRLCMRTQRRVLAAIVVYICGVWTYVLTLDDQARFWLPATVVVALLLWSVEAAGRQPLKLTRRDAADWTLLGLLFVLPLGFSFGTNMPVVEHSQLAAVFGVAAVVLMLHRLAANRFLPAPAVAICLAVLCVPTVVIQARAARDVHYTFRQTSALGEQHLPVRLGIAGDTLLVDSDTLVTLESVMRAAKLAGFMPGQLILDFTGDGPGFVYALGGRPLGLAWLLGGYPLSQSWAERMLVRLSESDLRSAWILSSADNPRAIAGWEQMLTLRIGVGSHVRVAEIAVRPSYYWGAKAENRDHVSLEIWRPTAAGHARSN